MGGAKFNSQVWLNGTSIGTYLNGYESFEFDIASWRDTGGLSNAPPLTVAAPRRFYRIRQIGP